MASEDLELGSNSLFTITVQELRTLHETKKAEQLDQFGGLKGIAEKLRTDLTEGLSRTEEESSFTDRKLVFGENVYEEPPSRSFFSFLFEALQDRILILLMFFSVLSILFGTLLPTNPDHRDTGWIEGTAILAAVAVVALVGAGNNYSKELKFRKLNKVKNDRIVKLIRGGQKREVSIREILVGDVILLDTGDYVPADGVYIDGHGLGIDESSMTGESDTVKKNHKAPYIISGCRVADGTGRFLVTAVGMNSEWGLTYSKLVVPREDTPLQESLGKLAKQVGLVGTVVAVLLFFVQTLIFIGTHANDDDFDYNNLKKFLHYFITSVTLVVVAVPEGLPLAVTIALAYSMNSMLNDKNLVRHLAACETMGGATNICSDKTGTLTENRMTVTSAWIGGKFISTKLEEEVRGIAQLGYLEMLATSVSLNSSSSTFLNFPKKPGDKLEISGSKTEGALLYMIHRLDFDYEEIRKKEKILALIPFSSERKRMSTIIESKTGPCLHIKGASEIILGMCSEYLDYQGKVNTISSDLHEELKTTINKMASEGLRTLSIAYKNLPAETTEFGENVEKELTLLAIVGIKDPLREMVPEAIRKCKQAGITVRMITGDNRLTATKIAQDAGILFGDGLVMEGPEFRKLSDLEIDDILPRLCVLARSSPTDKHKLVTRLRYHNEVVAVTGDGTNDGPALKAADVGMAMGIAGTEIAKEASDIIIMDDNFVSIVKAVMWGRNVRENIQRFLQFQLTINIVALSIAFIAGVSTRGEPLKPIQLLWVNLIQDSLAALALATERPTEELLNRKPYGRSERLISPIMWRFMVTSSIYNLIILLLMVYAGREIFDLPSEDVVNEPSVLYTMVFNTFVFIQLFNEINARKLDNDWNAFRGFFTNTIFLSVLGSTILLQIIFVQFGGDALETRSLDIYQWLICVFIGLMILPFHALVRVFVPTPQWKWLKYTKQPIKSVEK